jgi:hypothetical protein
MKWVRLVERGNRQILLTVTPDIDKEGYLIVIETHYSGNTFVSLAVEGFTTMQEAIAGMNALTDDEIVGNISHMLDYLSEDGQ